ncbi:MAG: putative bacteriocin export ABC transporter [Coriobacteriales bacterium]|jgi:putative ABC transport system ATP-binding protein|nr:putative bacteriocin export ABC transporter [Coriobacteriales bacterium]
MASMAISMKGITKAYGKNVILADFSLNVQQGEMIALQGVSGSGKSTILNICGLIENFDKGQLMLFEKKAPVPNSSAAQKFIRNEINYLFQNFALIENLTVEKNLLIALRYAKSSASEKARQISKALDRVGLNGYAKRVVFELSGGEQQRVSLARSVVKPARLLLADEPTGSLDQGNRDIVLDLLKDINRQGKTVVLVTHDVEVAAVCSRTVLLERQS